MRLLIALAATLALFGVIACGGDDDDATPTPVVTPTPTGPLAVTPTNVPTGSIPPTASPDLALQNHPDAQNLRDTLTAYVGFINDENWDGMCSVSIEAVRTSTLCDQIKESIVTAAANQGVAEGGIDATIDSIVIVRIEGTEAAARYTFCIVLDGTPNCTFPTVGLTKEADGWKVGLGL